MTSFINLHKLKTHVKLAATLKGKLLALKKSCWIVSWELPPGDSMQLARFCYVLIFPSSYWLLGVSLANCTFRERSEKLYASVLQASGLLLQDLNMGPLQACKDTRLFRKTFWDLWKDFKGILKEHHKHSLQFPMSVNPGTSHQGCVITVITTGVGGRPSSLLAVVPVEVAASWGKERRGTQTLESVVLMKCYRKEQNSW